MQKLIPAILAETKDDFDTKLQTINGVAAEVQVDFADGQFVSNLTVLPADIEDVKTKTKLQAHLMVNHPEIYFDDLIKEKFRTIIFHFEATKKRTAEIAGSLKVHHVQIGLALNPKTDVKEVKKYLPEVNLVTLLTVEPGFYGRPFIPYVLKKVQDLRDVGFSGTIQLDGGINEETILEAAASGADELVVGSAIFESADPAKSYQELLSASK